MKLVVLLLLVGFASSWIIYRRNQKRKLLCREENEWGNSTLPLIPIESVTGTSITESTTDMAEPEARRRRRDIPIDPVRKEPIIFLGGEEPANSTSFIDDGDFDIVSDHLTEEELAEVKAQIMHTCNALNRESRQREQGKSSNRKKTSRR